MQENLPRLVRVGKQVTFIIGSGTGGAYDTYGRVFARFYGRHIPGVPTIIVQNMVGASSIRATSFAGPTSISHDRMAGLLSPIKAWVCFY